MEFLEIYDKHYTRVRKFILTMVKDEWAADDLVQETFVRVGKNMGTIRDPSRITSWIFRVAYNLCQDHFRNLKKSNSNKFRDHERLKPPEDSPVQKEIEQNQMGTCVQDKMNNLPETLRTVLVLYDVMDFSHKEIAGILDITVENVKVRLHRARKKMKTILKEKCTFERDERNILICDPR